MAVMRYVWKFVATGRITKTKSRSTPCVSFPSSGNASRNTQCSRGSFSGTAQWEHRGMKFQGDLRREPFAVTGRQLSGAVRSFRQFCSVAGAMGQPYLLQAGTRGEATAEQLCDWWIMTGYLYFQSIRPFVRYDASTSHLRLRQSRRPRKSLSQTGRARIRFVPRCHCRIGTARSCPNRRREK